MVPWIGQILYVRDGELIPCVNAARVYVSIVIGGKDSEKW